MFNRCKHDWQIVGSNFTPGRGMPTKMWGGARIQDYQELIHGETVISAECIRCHQPKTWTLIGKWERQHDPQNAYERVDNR